MPVFIDCFLTIEIKNIEIGGFSVFTKADAVT